MERERDGRAGDGAERKLDFTGGQHENVNVIWCFV